MKFHPFSLGCLLTIAYISSSFILLASNQSSDHTLTTKKAGFIVFHEAFPLVKSILRQVLGPHHGKPPACCLRHLPPILEGLVGIQAILLQIWLPANVPWEAADDCPSTGVCHQWRAPSWSSRLLEPTPSPPRPSTLLWAFRESASSWMIHLCVCMCVCSLSLLLCL